VSSDIDESDILNTSEDKTEQPATAEDNSLELHDYTHEQMDEYLHKELELPRGGELAKARLLRRSRDGDGVSTCYRHENSILDTRQYEVEFQDGSVDTYTANVIAENLSAMVDPEGRQHSLFNGIIDHWYDSNDREESYTDKYGIEQPRMTTLGWELLVQWTDGTTSWHALADLKGSNPVEVAEYAVSRSLDNKSAFRW
jgi:hypothetical protein